MASISQPQIVYVGNIPYNATEKEIVEVLQEAGPLVSFRLKTENDGKSKGYGFCEYRDEETALSARRNLNGYPIRGRNLRVDENKGGGGDKKQPQEGAAPMPVQTPNPSAPRTTAFSNPSLPNPMQVPLSQFPPAVEQALLQQVLSLPPEKLSSLSPWERQQVTQLQQMYGSGSARSDSSVIICR